MENIKFNEVTWYSKLAALIVFVGLVPALTFYIGKQYGEVESLKDVPVYTSSTPQKISITTNNLSTPENIKYFKATTPITNAAGNYSNIVGYIAGGNFFLYVPEWIPDHWKSNDVKGGLNFSLRDNIPQRDFSDILILFSTTTEKYNAETLYSKQASSNSKTTLCISDTRCEVRENDSSIITSEVLLSRVNDTRIYHIAESTSDGMIKDTFYIDGLQMTAVITFSANKDSYNSYENIIRDFVQGIGKGEKTRG